MVIRVDALGASVAFSRCRRASVVRKLTVTPVRLWSTAIETEMDCNRAPYGLNVLHGLGPITDLSMKAGNATT